MACVGLGFDQERGDGIFGRNGFGIQGFLFRGEHVFQIVRRVVFIGGPNRRPQDFVMRNFGRFAVRRFDIHVIFGAWPPVAGGRRFDIQGIFGTWPSVAGGVGLNAGQILFQIG